MSNIVLFQDSNNTSFKSERMRKNIKAALLEAGLSFTHSKLDDESKIAHFITPFRFSRVERAKMFNKKIVISAFYTEGDKGSAISNIASTTSMNKISISQNYLKSFDLADKILVPSEEHKAILIKKGVKSEKITVLSPGVNFKIYRYLPETVMDLSRRYYSINQDAKVVLIFGNPRDKEQKRRVKELALMRPDCKCIYLVTNPDNVDSFSIKIDKLLNRFPPNLTVTTFKDINIYRSLLKNARCLLCFSSYYVDDVQTLEAMAAGLQIIGRKRAFSNEIIEKGLTINSDNKKELFRYICDFLDYKISNTVSEAMFYAEENDVKEMGSKLKEIYSEVLKEK